MKLPYTMGRYTLLRKLANGGMAEVYLARYDGEGGFSKLVAIKRILPDTPRADQFTSMLIDEAHALTHLQHQNIVQVYELGKDGDHFFISMEYVHGIDLGRILNAVISGRVALTHAHLIHIVTQLLQGLEFAHMVQGRDGRPLGLVHRDISPPNILCSWSGEVKIADFGIAKGNHRTHATTVNQLKGKYAYMSPEQSTGSFVDYRTDLYAAGIVLFELIAGARLFEDESDLKVLDKAKRARIPLAKLKDAPAELKEIVCTALMRDRATRYQHAGEFLSALNRYAVARGALTTGFEFGRFLQNSLPEVREELDAFCAAEARPPRPTTKVFAAPTVRERIQRSWFEGRSFRHGAAASLLMFMSVMLPASAARLGDTSRVTTATRVDAAPVALVAPTPTSDSPRMATSTSLERLVEAPSSRVAPTKTREVVAPRSDAQGGMGMISVNAVPWGTVTIPGYVMGRETPVSGVKVKAGTHTVTVVNAPADTRVSRRVQVAAGGSIRCLARFQPTSSIVCR